MLQNLEACLTLSKAVRQFACGDGKISRDFKMDALKFQKIPKYYILIFIRHCPYYISLHCLCFHKYDFILNGNYLCTN